MKSMSSIPLLPLLLLLPLSPFELSAAGDALLPHLLAFTRIRLEK